MSKSQRHIEWRGTSRSLNVSKDKILTTPPSGFLPGDIVYCLFRCIFITQYPAEWEDLKFAYCLGNLRNPDAISRLTSLCFQKWGCQNNNGPGKTSMGTVTKTCQLWLMSTQLCSSAWELEGWEGPSNWHTSLGGPLAHLWSFRNPLTDQHVISANYPVTWNPSSLFQERLKGLGDPKNWTMKCH